MEAIIFGSGSSRSLIKEVPSHFFTVSCNLSYPGANIIFARDEPVLEQIAKGQVTDFDTQTIFTPFREYEKYGGKRVMLLDEDKLWPNSQGLSTGVLAIATVLNFNFKKIYLCGFSFEKTGGTLEKLSQIIDSKHFTKLYVISNTFKHDTLNSITKRDFYGHKKT